MAEAQRAPPPSPVPLLSYGKPFSSTARKGWSRYAVERPRGIGGRAAGAQRCGGSGSIDDKDDEDFNIEEADSDELTGSMTMTQSDHVARLKTSEFIAERVSELDRSLRDLIVDSDERPET